MPEVTCSEVSGIVEICKPLVLGLRASRSYQDDKGK
jgi:hypothetical protein